MTDVGQVSIPGLRIDNSFEVSTATVAVSGRIDSGNASQLTNYLTRLVSTGKAEITLDLTDLEYLTSAGFRTLLVVTDAAEEFGGALVLSSLRDEVRELFDLSGLSRAFDIR